MRLGSSLDIAASALRFNENRLAVSANNVANADTNGFKASRVIPRESPTGGVDGVVRQQNGVQMFESLGERYESASSTDVAQETVERNSALTAYKATAAAYRTSVEMERTLVNTFA